MNLGLSLGLGLNWHHALHFSYKKKLALRKWNK